MYEAFTSEEIVSKLPIEASSIGCYISKEKLFIGTRQGHLITCNQNAIGASKLHHEYQVCRTFEKRPIIELQVVESHDLVICLTDAHLSIHDAIEPFKLLDVCSKYKPISAFSHFLTERQTLLIAISARKRLHIFKYLLGGLCEIADYAPIALPENALSVLWCGVNNLVLAFKCECQFWDMDQLFRNDESTNELSLDLAKNPTKVEIVRVESNETAPLVVFLPDLQMVAIRQETSTVEFFESNSGKIATHFNNCKFSNQLLALSYHHPYLIGILSKNQLEIRSINPPMLIQKIPLSRVSVICSGGRRIVYAANESQIWKLSSENHLQKNIRFLIEEKQFELAAQLAASPTQQMTITRQLAAKHFTERNFSKCFEIHNSLNTDALLVLNMFPFLIPDKYVAVISRYSQTELQLFEVSSDNMTEVERKRATQALIQFLVARRAECIGLVNQHYLDYNSGNSVRTLSTSELKRHEASLELIDTVLLKCYIKVNPSMVKSLLRSKNCCCIVSEAEKDLNLNKMFEELLILYEKRKMHRKYLELLQREVKRRETFDIKDIVNFLRRLKRDQMPLILEFSAPILSENIELGVQIFTSMDDKESVKFDRETVLQFLKKECTLAVIPYLEHVIYEWKDESPRFHGELLEHYVLRCRALLGQFLHSLSSPSVGSPSFVSVVKSEDDELSVLRKKLQYFLETDQHYSIESARDLIGEDQNLLEERAVIMGKLGQHSNALKIYTEVLMDFNGAERHCQSYYDERNASTHTIFFDLFHYYITGAMPQEKGNDQSKSDCEIRRRPNITEALKLFKRHPTKIDTVGAFALIPPSIAFNRICEAVKALFETSNNQLASTHLIVSFTNLLIRTTKKRLNELKRQRISITENEECSICRKRIMNRWKAGKSFSIGNECTHSPFYCVFSAFVRNRDHSFSHFFCYKNKMEST